MAKAMLVITAVVVISISCDSSDKAKNNDNFAPSAAQVSIIRSGPCEPLVGDTFFGSYIFEDVNGDDEDGSILSWYRDDEAISGATDLSYTLTEEDAGKKIRFGIIPATHSGESIGQLTMSPPIIVEEPPEDEPFINQVTFSAGDLSPAFHKDINSYSLSVGYLNTLISVVILGPKQYRYSFNGEDICAEEVKELVLNEGETTLSMSANSPTNPKSNNIYSFDINRPYSNEFKQQAYIKAFNADVNDLFGEAIALDGDVLAVGVPREDSEGLGVNPLGMGVTTTPKAVEQSTFIDELMENGNLTPISSHPIEVLVQGLEKALHYKTKSW